MRAANNLATTRGKLDAYRLPSKMKSEGELPKLPFRASIGMG